MKTYDFELLARRIAGRCNGDTLEISVKAEKQGTRQCINSYCYSISPANKPHHMEISEVWVGFDGEGCPGLTAWEAGLLTALARL